MVKNYLYKMFLLNTVNNKFRLLLSCVCVIYGCVMAPGAYAQSAGPYMVLKNMDNFPANDQLVFSLIQEPWRRTSPEVTPYNENHDRIRLRINNFGGDDLVVSDLVLSDPTAWKILSVNGNTSFTLPVSVATRNYAEVVVQFIAVDAATRVKVFHDKLTINSNDGISPAKEVMLHGLYQRQGEGRNEPYAQEIIDAFNFSSRAGYNATDGTIEGSTVVPNSEEIAVSHFVRADPAKPVKVYQLAAYHACCASTESFDYFLTSGGGNVSLFSHSTLDGQSLTPRIRNGTLALAQGSFEPSGAFGIRVGISYSDRTRNPGQLIGLRFLKAVDANGNVVPNAYFVNHDYIDVEFTNYDYQDNMYFIENVRPETGTANYSTLAPLTSSAVAFNPVSIGGDSTINFTVKNLGTTYDDSSTDPAITIKGITLSGPNASEFSLGSISSTNIPAQGTASLDVRFTPTSVGIKNASILISYNNSTSPLRIPLYGSGRSSVSMVSVVKRIKGGSDSNVTIGGIEYESDQAYRTGSVRLDSQVSPSDVAGTDVDQLYQTYLSAATDLAATGYNIPLTNGSYLVRMHFVENYFDGQPGQRVFSGTMEGQQILNNLDIYNEVGYRTAIVKDFTTSVLDDVLNINFTPTVNRLAIAAIEIFKITDTAMPVTLIDFTAAREGNTALLNWSTADEVNSERFEIQRSQSGKSWSAIGSVAAQGESVKPFSYSFVDANPLDGENLYRLKMIDSDSTYAYSKLVNLRFNIEFGASLYPNPVAEKLILKVDNLDKITGVQVFNMLGTMVLESRTAPAEGIDVKNLPSGMYVVHVNRTDGSRLTYKIVKN